MRKVRADVDLGDGTAMLCVRIPRKKLNQIKHYALNTGVSVQVLIQYLVSYGMAAKAHPDPHAGR